MTPVFMPRDWDPDDPMLKSPLAPHETAAVLRMQRAGFSGMETMSLLNMRATQLMGAVKKAMDDEQRAFNAGIPIHDDLIRRN
ncbi:hypothetical protein AU152_gp58 [Mycobacterium phage Phlei]|uniref:Gp68-like predicted RNA polymerase component domain-containing protein n=1 Tax=Mycobacterium phage Phlei TaxID=1690684 RepID=A0A0N9BDS6_9CAUD|nr:hypothetical protein AU152_gp58 [Mycobacterium phage Phlei]ALA48171.1 hypothetical protein [Mycobacterium phage Phlei]